MSHICVYGCNSPKFNKCAVAGCFYLCDTEAQSNVSWLNDVSVVIISGLRTVSVQTWTK